MANGVDFWRGICIGEGEKLGPITLISAYLLSSAVTRLIFTSHAAMTATLREARERFASGVMSHSSKEED